MPRSDRNITILRLNIPRRVHHLAVRIPCRIPLHPQVVPRHDVAALVGDAVGKQRQVIRRIKQRGVDDGARRAQGQRAARAGEAVHGNIAPAGHGDVAPALHRARGVQRHAAAGERTRAAAGCDLSVVVELPARVQVDRLPLQHAAVIDVAAAVDGQGSACRHGGPAGKRVRQLQR
ncbi:hypothetical protein P348_01961 [Enterobacter sp. DC3]|nr:hypothetical protein P348_01961 [Enterobacter sp. DC3]